MQLIPKYDSLEVGAMQTAIWESFPRVYVPFTLEIIGIQFPSLSGWAQAAKDKFQQWWNGLGTRANGINTNQSWTEANFLATLRSHAEAQAVSMGYADLAAFMSSLPAFGLPED